MEQRLKKLEPIIKEIMPHQVEFDELQVSGSNPLNKRKQTKELAAIEGKIPNELEEEFINYTWVNPEIEKKSPILQQDNNGFLNQDDDVLASYEDVVDEPVFGPCLIFGGQTAIWTGSDDQNEGIVALESRLNFETKAGKRVLATFEVFNAGTCAVYYDWKVKQI